MAEQQIPARIGAFLNEHIQINGDVHYKRVQPIRLKAADNQDLGSKSGYDQFVLGIDQNDTKAEVTVLGHYDFRSTTDLIVRSDDPTTVAKLARELHHLGLMENCSALTARVISCLGKYRLEQKRREMDGHTSRHAAQKEKLVMEAIEKLEALKNAEQNAQHTDDKLRKNNLHRQAKRAQWVFPFILSFLFAGFAASLPFWWVNAPLSFTNLVPYQVSFNAALALLIGFSLTLLVQITLNRRYKLKDDLPDPAIEQNNVREQVVKILNKLRRDNRLSTKSIFSGDGRLGTQIERALVIAENHQFDPKHRMSDKDLARFGKIHQENGGIFEWHSAHHGADPEHAAVGLGIALGLELKSEQDELKNSNKLSRLLTNGPKLLLVILKLVLVDILIMLPLRLIAAVVCAIHKKIKGDANYLVATRLEQQAIEAAIAAGKADNATKEEKKLARKLRIKQFLIRHIIPHSYRAKALAVDDAEADEPERDIIYFTNKDGDTTTTDLKILVKHAHIYSSFLDKLELSFKRLWRGFWETIKLAGRTFVNYWKYEFLGQFKMDYEAGLPRAQRVARAQKRYRKQLQRGTSGLLEQLRARQQELSEAADEPGDVDELAIDLDSIAADVREHGVKAFQLNEQLRKAFEEFKNPNSEFLRDLDPDKLKTIMATTEHERYNYHYPFIVPPVFRGLRIFFEFFEHWLTENPVSGAVAMGAYAYGIGALMSPELMAAVLKKMGVGFLNKGIPATQSMGWALGGTEAGAGIGAGFTYFKIVMLLASFDEWMKHGAESLKLEELPKVAAIIGVAYGLGTLLSEIEFLNEELGSFEFYGKVILGAKAGSILVDACIEPTDSFIVNTLVVFPLKVIGGILRCTFGLLIANLRLAWLKIKQLKLPKDQRQDIKFTALPLAYGWHAIKVGLVALVSGLCTVLDLVVDKLSWVFHFATDFITKVASKIFGTIGALFRMPLRLALFGREAFTKTSNKDRSLTWKGFKRGWQFASTPRRVLAVCMMPFYAIGWVFSKLATGIVWAKYKLDKIFGYIKRKIRFALNWPAPKLRQALAVEESDQYIKEYFKEENDPKAHKAHKQEHKEIQQLARDITGMPKGMAFGPRFVQFLAQTVGTNEAVQLRSSSPGSESDSMIPLASVAAAGGH